jgi:orotate phosphoribosyltransferase
VDDVATTGKALVEAKKALSKLGVRVVGAIVIVDRQEGARKNLARAGLKLESLFKKSDLGV